MSQNDEISEDSLKQTIFLGEEDPSNKGDGTYDDEELIPPIDMSSPSPHLSSSLNNLISKSPLSSKNLENNLEIEENDESILNININSPIASPSSPFSPFNTNSENIIDLELNKNISEDFSLEYSYSNKDLEINLGSHDRENSNFEITPEVANVESQLQNINESEEISIQMKEPEMDNGNKSLMETIQNIEHISPYELKSAPEPITESTLIKEHDIEHDPMIVTDTNIGEQQPEFKPSSISEKQSEIESEIPKENDQPILLSDIIDNLIDDFQHSLQTIQPELINEDPQVYKDEFEDVEAEGEDEPLPNLEQLDQGSDIVDIELKQDFIQETDINREDNKLTEVNNVTEDCLDNIEYESKPTNESHLSINIDSSNFSLSPFSSPNNKNFYSSKFSVGQRVEVYTISSGKFLSGIITFSFFNNLYDVSLEKTGEIIHRVPSELIRPFSSSNLFKKISYKEYKISVSRFVEKLINSAMLYNVKNIIDKKNNNNIKNNLNYTSISNFVSSLINSVSQIYLLKYSNIENTKITTNLINNNIQNSRINFDIYNYFDVKFVLSRDESNFESSIPSISLESLHATAINFPSQAKEEEQANNESFNYDNEEFDLENDEVQNEIPIRDEIKDNLEVSSTINDKILQLNQNDISINQNDMYDFEPDVDKKMEIKDKIIEETKHNIEIQEEKKYEEEKIENEDDYYDEFEQEETEQIEDAHQSIDVIKTEIPAQDQEISMEIPMEKKEAEEKATTENEKVAQPPSNDSYDNTNYEDEYFDSEFEDGNDKTNISLFNSPNNKQTVETPLLSENSLMGTEGEGGENARKMSAFDPIPFSLDKEFKTKSMSVEDERMKIYNQQPSLEIDENNRDTTNNNFKNNENNNDDTYDEWNDEDVDMESSFIISPTKTKDFSTFPTDQNDDEKKKIIKDNKKNPFPLYDSPTKGKAKSLNNNNILIGLRASDIPQVPINHSYISNSSLYSTLRLPNLSRLRPVISSSRHISSNSFHASSSSSNNNSATGVLGSGANSSSYLSSLPTAEALLPSTNTSSFYIRTPSTSNSSSSSSTSNFKSSTSTEPTENKHHTVIRFLSPNENCSTLPSKSLEELREEERNEELILPPPRSDLAKKLNHYRPWARDRPVDPFQDTIEKTKQMNKRQLEIENIELKKKKKNGDRKNSNIQTYSAPYSFIPSPPSAYSSPIPHHKTLVRQNSSSNFPQTGRKSIKFSSNGNSTTSLSPTTNPPPFSPVSNSPSLTSSPYHSSSSPPPLSTSPTLGHNLEASEPSSPVASSRLVTTGTNGSIITSKVRSKLHIKVYSSPHHN